MSTDNDRTDSGSSDRRSLHDKIDFDAVYERIPENELRDPDKVWEIVRTAQGRVDNEYR